MMEMKSDPSSSKRGQRKDYDKVMTAEAEVEEAPATDGSVPIAYCVADEGNGDEEDAPALGGGPTEESSGPRRFQVTAPANLPGGYRLNVWMASKGLDAEEAVIYVPEPGVSMGETFVGTECEIIRDRWSDGEFDCFSGGNSFGEIMLAAFCNLTAWACILKKLGYDACTNPVQDRLGNPVVAVVTGLFVLYFFVGFIPLVPVVFLLYFCFLRTFAMGTVRRQYRIEGEGCGDFCWANCCFSCCAVLQVFRHLKANGESPMPPSPLLIAKQV